MQKILYKIFFILFFILLFSFNLFSQADIIKNGSFEEVQDNAPLFWETMAWVNDVKVTDFKLETENTHSGKYCVSLTNKEANDSRYKQKIDLKAKSNYKISCWVKTENVGEDNKGANLSFESKIESSRDIRGTSDQWQLVDMYVSTGKQDANLALTLGLGGYGSTNTGKAYFDDVTIEKVDKIPEGISSISIDDSAKPNNNSADAKNKWVFLVLIGIALVIVVVIVILLAGKKKEAPASTTDKQETENNENSDDK